jgi:hypothetical protein
MLEKKKVTIEKVQQDKTVSIEISGFFYQRLHKFLQDYLGAQTPEQYLHALERIQIKYQGKIPEDSEALNLETMIVLIRTLEEAFQKEGYIDKEEVEIEVDTEAKKKD